MPNTLPDLRNTRVTQHTGKLDANAVAPMDQLLLILPRRMPAALWKRIPQGTRLQALMRKHPAGHFPVLEARLTNKRQTRVVAGKIAPGADAFERLVVERRSEERLPPLYSSQDLHR